MTTRYAASKLVYASLILALTLEISTLHAAELRDELEMCIETKLDALSSEKSWDNVTPGNADCPSTRPPKCKVVNTNILRSLLQGEKADRFDADPKSLWFEETARNGPPEHNKLISIKVYADLNGAEAILQCKSKDCFGSGQNFAGKMHVRFIYIPTQDEQRQAAGVCFRGEL